MHQGWNQQRVSIYIYDCIFFQSLLSLAESTTNPMTSATIISLIDSTTQNNNPTTIGNINCFTLIKSYQQVTGVFYDNTELIS